MLLQQVQTRLAAHAPRPGGLGAGYSFRVVDPGPLGAAEDLYKSLATCSEDR